MSELLPLLLPENLAPQWALALILTAALTSAVTAAMGAGGGVMLLAVMALVMPAAAIIPVHGLGGQSSLYSCYAAHIPRG